MRLEVARSAGWTLIEASSAQTLLLVIFLILARLLTPADYGLMALATTVLSVPQFILSNGIIPVIIHRESLSDDDLSTAFWLSLGMGAALTMLVVVCAEPTAWLLRNSELTPVLRWTAIPLVFMAIGNVPSALYQRRFQYGVFAIRSLVSFFFGGVVGIVMALRGAGVWSLVGNLVVQNVVSGSILWAGLGWYPRFRFNRASFIEMRDNIGHTVAGNFLASVTTRVDMLIIGAVDPALLGYYYFGQRLLLTISVGTYVPIGSILVPILSRMRGDIVGLRDSFIFMTWTAQVLWMPIVAGLGATASIMVPKVFGGNWTAAVPLLQIISLTSVTACLYQFTYSVLLTTDRASLYPRLTMLQLLIVVVLLVPATHFGLAAIGWAYVAASLITAFMHLVVVRRALRMSLCELIVRLSSVVVATGTMVLIVLWLGHQLVGMSLWIILSGQIVVGALVYLGVLFLMARSDTSRLMTTVFDLARRSR